MSDSMLLYKLQQVKIKGGLSSNNNFRDRLPNPLSINIKETLWSKANRMITVKMGCLLWIVANDSCHAGIMKRKVTNRISKFGNM